MQVPAPGVRSLPAPLTAAVPLWDLAPQLPPHSPRGCSSSPGASHEAVKYLLLEQQGSDTVHTPHLHPTVLVMGLALTIDRDEKGKTRERRHPWGSPIGRVSPA